MRSEHHLQLPTVPDSKLLYKRQKRDLLPRFQLYLQTSPAFSASVSQFSAYDFQISLVLVAYLRTIGNIYTWDWIE